MRSAGEYVRAVNLAAASSSIWPLGDILDTSPGLISRMNYGITNVVVWGHPGDIPGFPVDIWILGYNGCCVLVAG